MLRLKVVICSRLLLWTELCPPAAPQMHMLKPSPPVAVFGDRVFKEVIKFE